MNALELLAREHGYIHETLPGDWDRCLTVYHGPNAAPNRYHIATAHGFGTGWIDRDEALRLLAEVA